MRATCGRGWTHKSRASVIKSGGGFNAKPARTRARRGRRPLCRIGVRRCLCPCDNDRFSGCRCTNASGAKTPLIKDKTSSCGRRRRLIGRGRPVGSVSARGAVTSLNAIAWVAALRYYVARIGVNRLLHPVEPCRK